MKTIFNFLNKIGLVGSLFAVTTLAMSPLGASAISARASEVATPKSAVSKTSPFCTNLINETSNVTSKLNNLISNANQSWSNNDQRWNTLWQKVDTTVASDRSKADTERSQEFVKLQARAKTSTQKTAVQTYSASVINAVTVRRAAYDAARHTFREGVLATINTRKETVTSQFSSFQGSVNSAIQTAQSSCSSTPNDGSAIRTTLQTSLKAARETFQSDRKSDTTTNSQIHELAITRNAAFKAADQTFQNSITSARQSLEKAFSGSSI